MMDGLLAKIDRDLNEEAIAINDNIISGGCKDFADYGHQTGILKGLAMAQRAIRDLDEQLRKANEI